MQGKIDQNFGPGYWNNPEYVGQKDFLTDYSKKLNNWPNLQKHLVDFKKLLPEDAPKVPVYNEQGYGIKWVWGAKNSNELRINMAKDNPTYSSQSVDYVKVKFNGMVKDRYGNFIIKTDTGKIVRVEPMKNDFSKPNMTTAVELDIQITNPGDHPDAHIPFPELLNKKDWFKK
jgi:hypothetical protein